MSYIVTKPFKTPTRRLSVGDEIDAAGLDGPLSADDWVDLGYLEPAPEPMPALLAPPDDDPLN